MPALSYSDDDMQIAKGKMMGWNNMMGYGMFGGGFLWLLILGSLIIGGVWLVRSSKGGGSSGSQPAQPQSQSPIEILEIRYAKGEIDSEEYEEKRRTLESTSILPA
jgi:putative membrane protein